MTQTQNNFTYEEVKGFMVKAILSVFSNKETEFLDEFLDKFIEIITTCLDELSQEDKDLYVAQYNLIDMEIINKITTDVLTLTEEDALRLLEVRLPEVDKLEGKVNIKVQFKMRELIENWEGDITKDQNSSTIETLKEAFLEEEPSELEVLTWMAWDTDIDSDNSGFTPLIIAAETEEEAKYLFVLKTYAKEINAIQIEALKEEAIESYASTVIVKGWDSSSVLTSADPELNR